MHEGNPRVRQIACSDGLSATLAFYSPASRQPAHSHHYAQLSFLLAGEMVERHGGSEWCPPSRAMGFKPAGLQHDNMWGREGVLIFSVKLPPRLERTVLKNFGAGWSACSFAPVPALVRACIDEPDAALREPVIFDLIALCSAQPENPGPPPAWLIQAHDAIREEAESISIAGVAEAAGVHRVHLSSAFTQYFGIPPSLYRLQVLTARALGRIASGVTPLTQIAHEEGFSDQAHLSRSVRRATGTSPRRLRALLA